MTRKVFAFALLALLAITAHAQHFDWVKHYNGSHDNYLSTGIMRTATDSDGNLYVLGRFTSDAAIDGTYLNPMSYALNSDNRGLLVAKFSPEGQMLWHKVIYKYESQNTANVLPLSMRLIGDSALMVMANFDTPYREGMVDNRLYYLDTLLHDRGYPYPVDSVSQWEATAFITLGLNDGGLREHHFVQCALLDSAGHPFGNQYGWQALPLSTEDFDLDSQGNIYVMHCVANDRYLSSDRPSVEDGRVQGLRLIVDGVRTIDYTLPHRVGRWNQQVMKFAPHFDTLIAARYIVDSSTLLEGAADTVPNPHDIFCLQSFNIHGDNLYLCLYNNNLLDGATIDGNSSMVLHARLTEGLLLKMDTALVPQLFVQPDHWCQQEGMGASLFYNTAYDADSGSLFVLADYWTRSMTLTDFLLNAFFSTATSTNIYYSPPANNGVAELLGDNRLHLLGPGTVDIEATSYQYNPNSDDHHHHLTRILTVHPAEPVGIEMVVPENVKIFPNPTTGKVTVQIEHSDLKTVNGVATAWLTDMMGRREVVRLTLIGSGQYSLDLTSRPQATYLLTLTTAEGKQHTVRLLKQSDIFGR